MKKIKLLFFVLIFYTFINFILSFFLKVSLWGFKDDGPHKVFLNNKADYINSDFSFSVTSHIYDDLFSFDSLSYYVIENKLDALFILGDVGSTLNNKIVEQIDDLPYDLVLIPGNNDISNDKEYNEFVKRWGNYRVIQKKNTLFILLNSMDCSDNLYPHEGCWMKEKQLDFLEKELLMNNPSIDHIFIFSHHIYWWNDLNIFERLKLSRYTSLSFNDIINKFKRSEFRAGFIRLAKKILFFGNGVIFARNDYRLLSDWGLVHDMLKDIDKNIFVIGGDAPFNSHIEKDKIHYLTTGYVNFDWSLDLNKPKELFTIKIKEKNFKIINESLFYESKHAQAEEIPIAPFLYNKNH